MIMKKLRLAAIAICAASALTAPVQAQVGVYTKCRTVQGNIIIVQGYSCPAGTVFVGRA
jgi:hypothetical protein